MRIHPDVRIACWARLAACLLGALHMIAADSLAADHPPNVVYIMSDEIGYYELSCMGNPTIRTPRIDRMAAEGVRFTQALAGSSLCAPTRCCLMTGKHSGHTSVRTNGGGTPLRAGEVTIASLLSDAGYATGGFGKWGCGGRGSTGVPEDHGFDVFFGYYDQVHAHTYYPPYLVRNSEEVPLEGNQGGREGETYSQYVIFQAALDFIRENREQPFFCYLPVTPPHGMFDIPDDDPAWAIFKDEDWPEEARRYAAMISMVDRQVGQVLDLLAELGLEENTIVFFCGDNGGNDYFKDPEHPRGFHRPNVDPRTGAEFRGTKGTLYEGGLRIPMIVRWPGRIEPGRVSDLLCYFPDILPTVCELAEIDVPGDVDGMSIVPELLGPDAAGRAQQQHEYLYWELGRFTALRMNDWKLIRPRPNADWELYDLSSDISEEHNVAGEHADVLSKMVALAESAHEPAVEGTFFNREIHERDRRAKWGGRNPNAGNGQAAQRLPQEGLISSRNWKVVRVSSESRANGKVIANAFDGDPTTHWHTRWQDEVARHPHEIVIELGAACEIRGFRYLARQDAGWNGSLKEVEFAVSDDPDQFGEPVVETEFEKTKQPQEVECTPTRGQYVRLRILSEVNGGPWASIAELGVVGTELEEQQ